MVEKQQQKATMSFCFPGPLSRTFSWFFSVDFVGLARPWCQGAQAGSLSAAPFPVTVRQAPSSPVPVITQPSCQKAKESEKCSHPEVLLVHHLPFPWTLPGVEKKKTPIPSFGIFTYVPSESRVMAWLSLGTGRAGSELGLPGCLSW